MRGKWVASALVGLVACLAVLVWANGGQAYGHDSSSMSIQLVGHGYYSSYGYGRSYSYGYGWHHPPVVRPPAVVVPFPGHPPVVITPPTSRPSCSKPSHHYDYHRGYSSGHGSISIYGPRVGFSIAW